MANQIYLKSPCPNSTSLKIKTVVQTYFLKQVMSHFVHALLKTKSVLGEFLSKKSIDIICNLFNSKKSSADSIYNFTLKRKRKEKKKKLLKSIKWSSCHVIPLSELSSMEGFTISRRGFAYYDASWNSIMPTEEFQEEADTELSGYLQWLQEKDIEATEVEDGLTEIDRLAELFIASCHEKFKLEKQESYRRYQEMLARSL